MQKLPDYYVIKRDPSNPLWEKYIKWLNEQAAFVGTDEEIKSGKSDAYYGYDGFEKHNGYNVNTRLCHFQNSPTLITLEQWDEVVSGFVLPEKWCVKRDERNYGIINNWANNEVKRATCFSNPDGFMYSDLVSSYQIKDRQWPEITFDQFKKYVLKENDMNEDIASFYEPKDRTITAQQAQSIIDLACESWTQRLISLWAENICRKKDIIVNEILYKEMRRVCTDIQNTLLDSIFRKDKKEFTSTDLVTGEWLRTENGNTYLRVNDKLYCKDNNKVQDMPLITGKKVKIKSIEFEEDND